MRNISRSILLAFLIVTVWTGLSEAKNAAEPAAVIEVEQPTYAFEQVSQGDVVKHDFRVFNRGSAPLEIKGVKPGWGCSVARFDRTIPPGGEGTITLEVDTKNEQGPIHKTARVFSNDPNISGLTIGIKGNVWTPIFLSPKYPRLTGFLDEKISTIMHIKGQKQEPLKLQLVSVSIPDKVDVALKKTENGSDWEWELRVDNKVNQETDYTGQINLSTNYPEKPELAIRVSCNIRLPIETRPRVLDFGRLLEEHLQQLKTSGASVKRPVDVIFNKGVGLKVDGVDVKNSLFKVVNVSEKDPGRIYRIQIEPLWAKLKKGVNTDWLKIRTNQKETKLLEVPIVFEVQ